LSSPPPPPLLPLFPYTTLFRSHPGPLVDLLQLPLLDPLVGEELPHVAIDWIVLLRPTLELVPRNVVLVVVLGVPLASVGLYLDEVDALAAPGALHGGSRRRVHRQHVVAVHG